MRSTVTVVATSGRIPVSTTCAPDALDQAQRRARPRRPLHRLLQDLRPSRGRGAPAPHESRAGSPRRATEEPPQPARGVRLGREQLPRRGRLRKREEEAPDRLAHGRAHEQRERAAPLRGLRSCELLPRYPMHRLLRSRIDQDGARRAVGELDSGSDHLLREGQAHVHGERGHPDDPIFFEPEYPVRRHDPASLRDASFAAHRRLSRGDRSGFGAHWRAAPSPLFEALVSEVSVTAALQG